MRNLPRIAVASALLVGMSAICPPANAASSWWELGFSADVSGTVTYYCPDFANTCDDPLMDPITEPISGTVTWSYMWVPAALGTYFWSDEWAAGPFTGQWAFPSGYVTWDGTHFTGTDFLLYEGGTGNSWGVMAEASAPTFYVHGVPGQPGPVPEPSTWAMMLVGIAAIGSTMRRSKRPVPAC